MKGGIDMNIINLTQTQFRNYSNIHNERNFGQTIEYSRLPIWEKEQKLYLGLIDDNENVCAATLILIKEISPKVKEAIAPDGFLIDYSNTSLVKTFTEELTIYLKKLKITYLITNPMFHLKTYNKYHTLIENNSYILDNFYKLNYHSIGYRSEFERYDIILTKKNKLYPLFNRNTKRNIKESLNLGITLHKGSIKDINTFYEIIKKKTSNSYSYYYNLMNTFNTMDNKMEIFFAKLNPQTFLINMKKIYEKELRKNEAIHKTIQNRMGKMTEKIYNKKINSDHMLEKYRELLNKAITLSTNNTDDIIVATSAIIRNNKEIYFLIDGYKEQYRFVHATYILKWAIIKKYAHLGYKTFNLGEINQFYFNTNNKYHGQYMSKIGFGGDIIEYPPNLLLVINKPIYNIYTKYKQIKQKLINKVVK